MGSRLIVRSWTIQDRINFSPIVRCHACIHPTSNFGAICNLILAKQSRNNRFAGNAVSAVRRRSEFGRIVTFATKSPLKEALRNDQNIAGLHSYVGRDVAITDQVVQPDAKLLLLAFHGTD